MTLRTQQRGFAALAVAMALLFTAVFVPPSVAATARRHKLNWVQRHPTMTGIGTGMATHRALKISAARKKALTSFSRRSVPDASSVDRYAT